DRTAVAADLAVEHVEAGALARAVGADEGKDLASPQREGHASDCVHAAVRLRQVLDLEGGLAHRAASILGAAMGAAPLRGAAGQAWDGAASDALPPSVRAGRGAMMSSAKPPMPLGKAARSTTMTAPSTSFDRSVWLTSRIVSALWTTVPPTAP